MGSRGVGQVRIIGGAYRRRLLAFPSRPGLRPTPGRVRETLFNWLGQRLDGLACLDLFAGCGGLGFEAASRGALRVVMVEHDRVACAALSANREKLTPRRSSCFAATHLNGWIVPRALHVVFLDPVRAECAAAGAGAIAAGIAAGARYIWNPKGRWR